MAETKTLRTQILLRNDSAANWETQNPVLGKGECGIELDTNNKPIKFKFGDGKTAWNSLAYVGTSIKIEGEGEVIVGAEVNAAGELVLTKGKLLDSNIMLSDGFTFTENVGTVKVPASGSIKVGDSDTTLRSFFVELFAKAKNPTVTQPAASIVLNQAGAKEVGTKVTPTYTASLTAGSYTYGPATGISAISYSVTDGVTGHDAQTGATGTFHELQVVDNTNYKLTATIAHGAGANPKNNLEKEVPDLAIKAGSKTATSAAITGYRSVFAGASVTPITIDSASIRGLKGKTGAYAASFNLAIPEGCTQVVIALPNGHTVKKVEDVGAFGTDIFSVFVKQTAQVEGANNYTAAAYNVYVYTPASALGANTYKVTCA